MALFAPGWTHETLNKEPEDDYLERFLDRDNALWMRLWPFLYTHPITTIFDTSFYLGVDKVSLYNGIQGVLHKIYLIHNIKQAEFL